MNTTYKRQRIYSTEIGDAKRDGLCGMNDSEYKKPYYVHGKVMLDRWRSDFKYFKTKEAAQEWLNNIKMEVTK